MKRLVADVLLILIIVCLGKMVINDQDYSSIENKIKNFDQQVSNNRIIDKPDNIVRVNQIEENFAGQLGNSISDMIYTIVKESVNTISNIFVEN